MELGYARPLGSRLSTSIVFQSEAAHRFKIQPLSISNPALKLSPASGQNS
jgi:hypothetical protein